MKGQITGTARAFTKEDAMALSSNYNMGASSEKLAQSENIIEEVKTMDEGFFGGLFDLNGDGELDAGERTLDFMAFNDLMIGAEKAERPEYVQELEDAGLDYDELWHMTDWERREALEDAGMDPDDFEM